MTVADCWTINFASYASPPACLPSESLDIRRCQRLSGQASRTVNGDLTFPSTQCTLSPTTAASSLSPMTFAVYYFDVVDVLCIIFRTSESAIRASSYLNPSNLMNASSMSAIPAKFLKIFSTRISAKTHVHPI